MNDLSMDDNDVSQFADATRTHRASLKTSTPIRNETPLTQFCGGLKRPRSSNAKNPYSLDPKLHKAFKGIEQLDVRLVALLITVGIFLIAYKMVLIAVPYANSESFNDMWSYTNTKWTEFENHIQWKHIWPLLCGLAFTIFSVAMVHLDSSVPGVIPPSPFSPRRKQLYRQHQKVSIDFNYITVLGAGAIVTGLLYMQAL